MTCQRNIQLRLGTLMSLLVKPFGRRIATPAVSREPEVQNVGADDQTRTQEDGDRFNGNGSPSGTVPQQQAQDSRAEQRQAGNPAVFFPVSGNQSNHAHSGGPKQEQWLELLRDVDQGR